MNNNKETRTGDGLHQKVGLGWKCYFEKIRLRDFYAMNIDFHVLFVVWTWQFIPNAWCSNRENTFARLALGLKFV